MSRISVAPGDYVLSVGTLLVCDPAVDVAGAACCLRLGWVEGAVFADGVVGVAFHGGDLAVADGNHYAGVDAGAGVLRAGAVEHDVAWLHAGVGRVGAALA